MFRKIALSILLATFGCSPALSEEAVKKTARVAMTSGWFELAGKSADNAKTYRKYAFIILKDNFDVRNHYILNCSTNASPTHLTVVLPKELDIPSILGKKDFLNKSFNFSTVQENGETHQFSMDAEVMENELFFDFVGNQRLLLHHVITAKSTTIFLREKNFPLEFFAPGDEFKLPDFDNANKTLPFDQWNRTMFDRNGQATRYLTHQEVYRECKDIGDWAKASL